MLKILFVRLNQDNVLLLELIKNVRSVEKTFKGVEKFESSKDNVGIIKTLSKHRGQPSLKFLDVVPELIEISIELFLVDVHNVIFDFLEVLNSFFEFGVNSINGFC